MAGVYRAYGQLRRGSGPWRSPFLIPVGDLVPPLIFGSSYVSIDTSGTAPDLRIALIVDSFNSLSSFRLKFRIQKMPGRSVADVTLRIVLLKSSTGLLVDQGDFAEPNVSFAVLQHRVAPGHQYPAELNITAGVGGGFINPAIDDPAINLVVPPGPPSAGQWASLTAIGVRSSDNDQLDMAGGLVSGNIIKLSGVETVFNPTNPFDPVAGQYGENAHDIRGIDLRWLDDVTTPLPSSATWVNLTATNPTASATEVGVSLWLAQQGDAPAAPPTVATVAGGALRPGTYRYRLAYLESNGNESPAGPRSGPVTVGANAADPRSVRVDGFPPLPLNPDTGNDVTNIRIYRTDPDTGPSADPGAGDAGSDVLVAHLALAATSFVDTGVYDPTTPGHPGALRPDLIVIDYSSPMRLGLVGGIRMVDAAVPTAISDTQYSATVATAPNHLRVAYQPGTAPLLRWGADAATPALGLFLGSLETPLGEGVNLAVEDVPRRLGIDWTILGSEYFAIALAAATSLDPTHLGTDSIGRVSARIGVATPPVAWPDGDAAVTAELITADGPRAGTSGPGAGALISLSRVRRAGITRGARLWVDRDVALDRLGIDALFADGKGVIDRDLRITRRSGAIDPLQHLQLNGHLLPAEVRAAAWLAPERPIRIELDTRVRWLRGELALRVAGKKVMGVDGPTTTVAGRIFLDDVTGRLRAEVGDRLYVELESPARVGGRADIATMGRSDNDRVVLRPDVILPPRIHGAGTPSIPSLQVDGLGDAATHLVASVAEPGLSARVAASFGNDLPVVVRANPQIKLLTHGDTETTTGTRAVSGRVDGVLGADLPTALIGLSNDTPAPGELPTTVSFSHQRPNGSLRAEIQEREHRIAFAVDDRATTGVRSWLRARTAHLPDTITATPALVGAGAPTGFTFGGMAIAASEVWGPGVLWAEPGAVWTEHLTELGTDRGIGLMTAGFDGIPSNVEVWMLEHSAELGTRVPADLRLPSVGPVGADWAPGGAVLRVDGPVSLHHVQMATPGGDSLVCRTDDGDDHPVRHGNWTEVIAPFVRIEPTDPGLTTLVVWSAGEQPVPPDPSAPPIDPCDPPDGGPSRKTALGWNIDASLRLSMAVRLYSLNTPSGIIVPRWWSMPTSDEDWDDVDDPRPGIWYLNQEVQMRDSQGIIAFYSDEGLDNPFGDWEAGPGHWWLRIRDGLDAFLGSGDAYMGNVGGGYHFLGSNGIYSTLPRIWNWTYP